MSKYLKLAAIAATVAIAGPALAQTAAVSLPGGDSAFTNGSWVFAQRFQVGATPLTLTALGAYDSFGDGFSTDGGIQVGLYRESDETLLSSANIQSSDMLDGNYRFANVSSVNLVAGEVYRVVAVSGSDNYNLTTGSLAPGLIDLGEDYCSGATLQYCGGHGSDNIMWMGNFKFNEGASGAVPEPASWALMLGGFGLVGGAMRSRRNAAVSFG